MSQAVPLPLPTSAAGHAAPAGVAVLTEITAGLASGDGLPALLRRFLVPIMRVAGARAGAVRILGDEDARMHLISSIGLPAAVRAVELDVGPDCGACGAATRSREPIWTEDLSPCARRSEGHFMGRECTRMLAVPLQHQGRVLGVYTLYFADRQRPDAGVTSLLKAIGEVLGLALHNGRLEREQRRSSVIHERQRIAADVHDSVSQSLSFVKMRLPLLEDAIAAGDRERASRYLADIREVVGEAHGGLREILSNCRAPLDPKGLLHALRRLAEGFERRHGVALEFVSEVPSLGLTPEREAEAFHIVQEALTNVARHAMAQHARVVIAARGGEVLIRIEDDGTALTDLHRDLRGELHSDLAFAARHHGVSIMRERAARLGGSLEMGARPEGGTWVALRFPLDARDEAPKPAPGEGAAP